MSRLESAEKIEGIVGVPRHESIHVARAVSAEERVYILHSRQCTLAYSDLRQCPYSVALDEGIDLGVWEDWQDRPVEIRIDEEYGDLVPERTHVSPESASQIEGDLIPAGGSGKFRITEQMMFDAGAETVAKFESLLRDEASRRGLVLVIERELPSGDVIVSWRPGDPS